MERPMEQLPSICFPMFYFMLRRSRRSLFFRLSFLLIGFLLPSHSLVILVPFSNLFLFLSPFSILFLSSFVFFLFFLLLFFSLFSNTLIPLSLRLRIASCLSPF